jgi:predicted regulator of Ras-like GTPase activity (Roadblock/LC7/MglB family)
MLNSILSELAASSGSILETGIMSRDGLVIASQTVKPEMGIDSSGYVYTLLAAMGSVGHNLTKNSLGDELDWILLTNSDSKILLGSAGENRFLCCLLDSQSEADAIIYPFKSAADKISQFLA